MFGWLKKRKDVASVKITIAETLAFTGIIESFDIYTDIKGSDAYCVIRFKAGELLKTIEAAKA